MIMVPLMYEITVLKIQIVLPNNGVILSNSGI